MEKMKKGINKGRDLISHKIDSRKLTPGDHICAYRDLATYSHHGIFVGDGYVIHFTSTNPKKKGKPKTTCQKCPSQSNVHPGVVKTCIDCFLREGSPLVGHSLHLCQYGVPKWEYKFKKSGSCSTLPSKSPEEVVNTATELFCDKGFGEYDLATNNCEHFATFCKTGIASSAQVDSAGRKTATVLSSFGFASSSSNRYGAKRERAKKKNPVDSF